MVTTSEETSSKRTFVMGPCLGKGGFGEVYLATMTSSSGVETQVAVKILNAELAGQTEAMVRLRDEARWMGRLNHPVILKVVDLVGLDGRVALVTEYVDGQDFSGCVNGEDPLSLRACLQCMTGVADALAVAWSAPVPGTDRTLQLVHRDIKPSNIRISRHGQVKLLDFGIARTDQIGREAMTQTNMMIGSPIYMAPERLNSMQTLSKSDVYALGLTLYEAIAKEKTFKNIPLMGMTGLAFDPEGHDEFIAGRLAKITGKAPPEVMDLLKRVLAHDPDTRPSAQELSEVCETLAGQRSGASLLRWCKTRNWPSLQVESGSLEGQTLIENAITSSGVTGSTRRSGATRAHGAAKPAAAETSQVPLGGNITVMAPISGTMASGASSQSQLREAPRQQGLSTLLLGMGLGVVLLVLGAVGAGIATVYWVGGSSAPPTQTTPIQAPPTGQTGTAKPPTVPNAGQEGTATDGTATDGTAPATTKGSTSKTPASDPKPAPKPRPKPRPKPTPTPEVKPTPTPVPDPVGTEAPKEAPKPAPQQLNPDPPPPSKVRVGLTGADIDVFLQQAGQRFRVPGKVVPGTYKLVAVFSPPTPVNLGSVTIQPNSSPVVSCDLGFRFCELKQ